MNPFPAVNDSLWAEFRPDQNIHFPSTVVHPNGSLVCCTDYELCGALAREVIKESL